MPNYKAVDAGRLDAAMTATADAIREKTSGTDPIPWNADTGFAEAVAGITGGGAAVSVPMKDVNFYDYDGTRLYSYTVAEAAALAELPPLPTQPGLICQGWNWTLDGIKAMNRAVDVGATYITSDGKTRVYVTLHEGRTSPMMGLNLTGTAYVDWGDDTEHDALTGTGSTVWTPAHNYAEPGDYVITLTVEGKMSINGTPAANTYSNILRHSNVADARNRAYQNSVQKIEVGEYVTLGAFAFRGCCNLKSIIIPKNITTVSTSAFYDCFSLPTVVIPDGVTSLNTSMFYSCYSLSRVLLPDGIITAAAGAFNNFISLADIVIPDDLTKISNQMFSGCFNLTGIVVPKSVTIVDYNAFFGCSGVRFYDFSNLTAVPQLSSINAFEGISEDCEIRVPAALADEWKAATNWSTYADYIVGV